MDKLLMLRCRTSVIVCVMCWGRRCCRYSVDIFVLRMWRLCTVTPSLLGIRRVVSEDSVRRGLKRLIESPEKCAATDAWLRRHLQNTLNPLMSI